MVRRGLWLLHSLQLLNKTSIIKLEHQDLYYGEQECIELDLEYNKL